MDQQTYWATRFTTCAAQPICIFGRCIWTPSTAASFLTIALFIWVLLAVLSVACAPERRWVNSGTTSVKPTVHDVTWRTDFCHNVSLFECPEQKLSRHFARVITIQWKELKWAFVKLPVLINPVDYRTNESIDRVLACPEITRKSELGFIGLRNSWSQSNNTMTISQFHVNLPGASMRCEHSFHYREGRGHVVQSDVSESDSPWEEYTKSTFGFLASLRTSKVSRLQWWPWRSVVEILSGLLLLQDSHNHAR